MKNLLKLIPVLLIIFILTGCGEEEVAYRNLNQIKESGQINIAFVTDQYSFMTNDTNPEANEAEKKANSIYLQEEVIIGNMLNKLGVKADVKKVTREEAVNAILDGTADIALGKIDINESDKFKVNYTLKYAEETPYIITNKDVNVFSYSDLSEKKVAIIGSDPISKIISDQIPSDIKDSKEYKTMETALGQLKMFNIDAIICYKEKAIKAVNENPNDLQINNLSDSEKVNYAAIIAKGNDKLLEEVNTVINEYFNPAAEPKEPGDTE